MNYPYYLIISLILTNVNSQLLNATDNDYYDDTLNSTSTELTQVNSTIASSAAQSSEFTSQAPTYNTTKVDELTTLTSDHAKSTTTTQDENTKSNNLSSLGFSSSSSLPPKTTTNSQDDRDHNDDDYLENSTLKFATAKPIENNKILYKRRKILESIGSNATNNDNKDVVDNKNDDTSNEDKNDQSKVKALTKIFQAISSPFTTTLATPSVTVVTSDKSNNSVLETGPGVALNQTETTMDEAEDLSWLGKLQRFGEDTLRISLKTNSVLVYVSQLIISIVVVFGLIVSLFKMKPTKNYLLHSFLKDFRRMQNADTFAMK